MTHTAREAVDACRCFAGLLEAGLLEVGRWGGGCAVGAVDACRCFAGLLIGALSGVDKQRRGMGDGMQRLLVGALGGVDQQALLPPLYCPVEGFWGNDPLAASRSRW